MSDSKSPKISRTLLGILAGFNNIVVWMVSTRPLISKSSNPCTNILVTVPGPPITSGIIVTLMYHCFFSSRARSRYLSFFSLSFSFALGSAGTIEPNIWLNLFFFLFFFFFFFVAYYHSVWSSGQDCNLKSQWIFCLIFLDGFWVVDIPLVRKVKSIIILTPWEFFTSVLADGLSLETEWQQVSSSLQDSSQYSCRSQQYCCLDCLHLFSHFQVL